MNTKSVGFGEVLAAFLIVGAVGAVVAPVLTRADPDTDKAKANTCVSNVKQLGLAVLMYDQDYDQREPSGANWYGTGSGWAQQVRPYILNQAVLRCPSDSNGSDVVSYGYNSNLVELTGAIPSRPKGVPLAEIAVPAGSIMLFEVANNGNGTSPGYVLSSGSNSFAIDAHTDIHRTGNRFAPFDGWSPAGRGLGAYKGELSGMGADPARGAAPLQYATGLMSGSDTGSEYFNSAARHEGRSVFAFLDGHVKTEAPGMVSAGKNNPIIGNSGGDDKAANSSSLDGDSGRVTFSVL